MPRIREIVWTTGFKRAFRKRLVRSSDKRLFEERLKTFVEDPFDPRLKAHKLTGMLAGLWSFSVTYDCRVIFKFHPDDTVVLIDIGQHDEVY